MTPTERYGVGQSGYTAGRRLPDPALDSEVLARTPIARTPEDEDDWLRDEIATDERWYGRGGPVAPSR